MCGFTLWIVAVVGSWIAYFNAKNDVANNPGGATTWLWISIIVSALFFVPLLIAFLGRQNKQGQ